MIDLLTKNDKIHNKLIGKRMLWPRTKVQETWVLVLGKGGELGRVVGWSLGGESWDGKEEGEIEEERVGKVLIFWLLPMESPTEKFCRYTDGHSSFEFRDNNIKSCVLYSFFFFWFCFCI